MANETNNADKLIERIRLDSMEEISRMNAAADDEIKRARELADNDVWEIEGETGVRIARERDSILERSRTNAQLDARKYTLEKKRELLDSVFVNAGKKLDALSGAQREALLSRTLLNEADGGEQLCPAPADMDALTRLLPEINKQLASSGKAPLTLGAAAKIAAGFILVAPGYEKDCSFAAMLRDTREVHEAEVAGLLFL